MWTRILLTIGLAWVLCWSLTNVLQAQADELEFPGAENWDTNIGSINLTRTVHSLAFDHQYLYLGEGFGSSTERLIRRWDGNQWTSIGNTDGPVSALLADGAGGLYAGGYFTQTSTCNPCKRIAHWNGSTWSALGSGLEGEVLSLAKDNLGNLYAGGDLGVSRWNGTSWFNETLTDTIYVLRVSSNNVIYAGGRGSINDDNGDLIEIPSLKAKVEGTWINLGKSFINGGPNGIFSIALYPNNSFTPTVGGSFEAPTYYLASWDEDAWKSLDDPPNGYISALIEDTCGGFYVGGKFKDINDPSNPLLAYFNGQTWYSLSHYFTTTNSSKVETLAFNHGYLAVGGVFNQTFDSENHRNIALWTGRDCAQITASGTYTFYNWREPVTIQITNPGNLAEIRVQRFNKTHPEVITATTPNLDNNVYWQIEGVNSEGQPASGFVYTLTLPSVGFTPDTKDKICHYEGNSKWDCAASGFDPIKRTITRSGLTSFSEFTVGDDVGPTVVTIKSMQAALPRSSTAIVLLGLLTAVWVVYSRKK